MKEFWKNLKFAWTYAKDQKGKLIKYILCNMTDVAISILVPILSAQIIVNLTSNKFQQLLLIALVIFGVEILRNCVSYLAQYYSQVLYRETFIKIQTALGKEILKIENGCIDKNTSGLFIQRLTNDTSKISDIFNVLNMYVSGIIMDCGIFVAIFIINRFAFFYIVLMVITLYLISSVRVKKYNERDKVFRKKNENVSGFVGEIVRGLRDIKMLNAENNFLGELHKKVRDLNEERYGMGAINRKYNFLINCMHDLFDLGLIGLEVLLIIKNSLTVPNALVIHNYRNQVTSLVHYIGSLMDSVKDFNLSASRIFDIINSKEFPKEKFGTKHLDKVNGDFEFKNVTFHYDTDDTKVLNNISFKVNANETVAFVGKSGAGKTTIFNLLCKMYEPTKGKITIDGTNISELDKDTIRGNITIISQNPYIFHVSIRDNLRFVKEDLTDEEMIEACRLACLHDYIMSLPEKYDTIVGEGGVNLSGGQRQRLAIARAFVQKTEIILFDEATSALDNETQSSIQKAIDNMKKDYTILIIAHRLSTVINSDRILFLKEGRINGEGTHQQLLKDNVEYRHLYESELQQEKK